MKVGDGGVGGSARVDRVAQPPVYALVAVNVVLLARVHVHVHHRHGGCVELQTHQARCLRYCGPQKSGRPPRAGQARGTLPVLYSYDYLGMIYMIP